MITTITLNPAFDVHVSLEEFKTGREFHAKSVMRHIGGKGINISRALLENGINNSSLVVVGTDNCDEFIKGLDADGLNYQLIEYEGRIRENITIHTNSGEETRLSFKGFNCKFDVLIYLENKLINTEYVTFTGSVPEGISCDKVEEFLIRLRNKGIKLVIDSKSVSLDMLRRIKPWLIKPNREEIESYCKRKMDIDSLYSVAGELNADCIDNVMISLGAEGAILASDGKVYRAYVPKIEVISTIGAGDSSIAGFLSSEKDSVLRLKNAVAYGTAACMREGTKPPLDKDIKMIFDSIKVEVIKS